MADFYHDIYNKEIKERFLDSINLEQYPVRWWERLFEKTYIFEQSKNKDLYSFTTPEILEFYKFLDVGTLSPLIIYNVNLTTYAQWALNENLILDGQNHFDILTNDILMTCVNKAKLEQSILSYDYFLDIINDKMVNYQDRFIFFCLWEGIKGKDYEDIVNMKLDDIDEKNRIVALTSGRETYVSKEFVDIAKAADKQLEYTGLTDTGHTMLLTPSPTIYKPKSNSRGIDTNRSVYNTILRNIHSIPELSTVVTAKTIRDSGMIYYLNKRADKLGVSVEELIYNLENCRDIIEKYGLNIRTRKRWLLQYSEFIH